MLDTKCYIDYFATHALSITVSIREAGLDMNQLGLKPERA